MLHDGLSTAVEVSRWSSSTWRRQLKEGVGGDAQQTDNYAATAAAPSPAQPPAQLPAQMAEDPI